MRYFKLNASKVAHSFVMDSGIISYPSTSKFRIRRSATTPVHSRKIMAHIPAKYKAKTHCRRDGSLLALHPQKSTNPENVKCLVFSSAKVYLCGRLAATRSLEICVIHTQLDVGSRINVVSNGRKKRGQIQTVQRRYKLMLESWSREADEARCELEFLFISGKSCSERLLSTLFK